ncbi:nucleotidyltransferase family protein [Methanosarcina mazei]|uniref:protein adenylyltransferase n=4 Tax=Methanosarcina mazei TaxID=2209 RepID=A0A0F8MP90_METMZ|nr:nucleotidyltransferase family protein [Methanosarcina mazei]AGF96602.1 nucleotidyltransferase [Methanosarcina mazei Tuc01]AKB60131.1 nucleotidyltransferase [Methanosarcina mazei SarPi]AKB66685.1 nucleotidyltransferase [Methanosarcina mazei LYC]KKG29088.1 DNA polymerase III subunit beta [Methanosarcina mazei]KKG31724.1 DNA polymerase III subunit beta [Methanosarcina mazei]
MKLQGNQREVDIYIKKLQGMLPELKKKYPIKYIGVFGSYVRGEQSASSDLDILVEFNGSITLLGYARLENELSDKLGIKVDLVSKTALKPRIGKHILSEVVEV